MAIGPNIITLEGNQQLNYPQSTHNLNVRFHESLKQIYFHEQFINEIDNANSKYLLCLTQILD